MNPTEQALLEETKKWLARLEEKKLPESEDSQVKEQLTNVKAYISDCKHFIEKKDYIRAFEAVIYAWGIYDSLSCMHLIKNIGKKD